MNTGETETEETGKAVEHRRNERGGATGPRNSG